MPFIPGVGIFEPTQRAIVASNRTVLLPWRSEGQLDSFDQDVIAW